MRHGIIPKIQKGNAHSPIFRVFELDTWGDYENFLSSRSVRSARNLPEKNHFLFMKPFIFDGEPGKLSWLRVIGKDRGNTTFPNGAYKDWGEVNLKLCEFLSANGNPEPAHIEIRPTFSFGYMPKLKVAISLSRTDTQSQTLRIVRSWFWDSLIKESAFEGKQDLIRALGIIDQELYPRRGYSEVLVLGD